MSAIVHRRQKSINLESYHCSLNWVQFIFASKLCALPWIDQLPILIDVCTHARTIARISSQKISNCSTLVTFSWCSFTCVPVPVPFKHALQKRQTTNDSALRHFTIHDTEMYFGYCEWLKCLCCIMYWTILWLEKSWNREWNEKLDIIVTMPSPSPLKWTISAHTHKAQKMYMHKCVRHVCYSCHVAIKFNRKCSAASTVALHRVVIKSIIGSGQETFERKEKKVLLRWI